MNRKHLLICLWLCFLGIFSSAMGQTAKVVATLEPPKILIGEETTLIVRVAHPKGSRVELALPADTLVNGVEIKGFALADSTAVTEKLQEYIYHVTLTSFDSASYRLDHIAARVGGELYNAEETPILMVNTLPVDVDHPEKFADIKDQWKPAFVWKDYVGVGLALLGLMVLLVAGYFLLKRFARRAKAPEKEEVEPLQEKDPYLEAVEDMNLLKSSDLIANGRIKEYYTGMTDILRRYLRKVYGIETAEKTSSEILSAFRGLGEKESELWHDLRRILETADFAKFAKYAPSQDENTALWNVSRDFVEEVHKKNTAEEPEKGGEPES